MTDVFDSWTHRRLGQPPLSARNGDLLTSAHLTSDPPRARNGLVGSVAIPRRRPTSFVSGSNRSLKCPWDLTQGFRRLQELWSRSVSKTFRFAGKQLTKSEVVWSVFAHQVAGGVGSDWVHDPIVRRFRC